MFRDWWRSLERAPEPLSARQWGAVIAATAVAAISRLFALARTPWDWDELLFMLSLDHFNVSLHHPHPPGFPLYVLAAKGIAKLGLTNFHSLQALSLLGAIGVVPAMFFLCRELRVRFSTSLSAALLLAFFPNVWFYGGGAWSDVPSMTLVVAAIAFLLAGCRDARAYFAGALILAVSAGFRPQNLLVGCVPLLIASALQWRRSAARVAGAFALIAVIVALSYAAAAWVTGLPEYMEASREHRAYIMRVDSFLSPARPPLWRVFDDFFVAPYHAPAINIIVTALVLISIVRLRPHVLVALASFGPLALVSWLVLDHYSASRFSIGYAPLIALLAADGLQLVARHAAIEALASAIVIALMIVWTWPALSVVRSSVAPPVAAVEWIRSRHAAPLAGAIYVSADMIPFAQWYLGDYRLHFLDRLQRPPIWPAGYYLFEGATKRGPSFVRTHGRLWELVRHRYFDVSVRPIPSLVVFGNGWSAEERSPARIWRWMGRRSEAVLPPLEGPARLTLSFYIPRDAIAAPKVVIRLNGAVVDAFRGEATNVDRQIMVQARSPNVLEIETDRVVLPWAGDERTLGLRLNAIEWTTVRP